MATQNLPPDAILATEGNLNNVDVANIQDDPSDPDGNWITAGNNNSNAIRCSMEAPVAPVPLTHASSWVRASSQYAQAEETGPLGYDTKFTVEFWAKQDAVAGNMYVVSYGNMDWGVRLERSGENTRFGLLMFTSTGDQSNRFALVSNVEEEWHHFAVVVDCTIATNTARTKFYLDGVEQSVSWITLGDPNNVRDSSGVVTVGALEISDVLINHYGGSIADLRIWKTARAASQISDSMHSPVASHADLVANYYRDNSHNDLSGGGFHLSPVNSPTFDTDTPYTPAATLEEGSGLQTFRAWVRKNAANGGTPTLAVELWEDGALVAVLGSAESITSATGQLVTRTFDAASLADLSGVDVEVKLDATHDGAGGNRRTVEYGALAWDAEVEEPEVIEELFPSGIASAEAFGTLTTENRLDATGIASEEAFGTPEVSLESTVEPTGIASAEAFGSATLESRLSVTGIASAEEFGTLTTENQLQAVGVSSEEVFGTPSVEQVLFVDPTGIPSEEEFGAAVLEQRLDVAGIPSSEAFGTLTTENQLDAVGVESEEAFGLPSVEQVVFVSPVSIESAEAFGTASLEIQLRAVGIASEEAFGTLSTENRLDVAGIESEEAFGSPSVEQVIFVDPESIASAEAFGLAAVENQLLAAGIASQEAFGTATTESHVFALAIPTEEAFGTPLVEIPGVAEMFPVGIASAEAVGTPRIGPLRVASAGISRVVIDAIAAGVLLEGAGETSVRIESIPSGEVIHE